METAAVPARTWLAPLADAALVLVLPALLTLALWSGPWAGPLIGAFGVALVLLVGRGPYDGERTHMIAMATLFNLAACGIGILLVVTSSCSRPAGHGVLYAYAGMGVVFVDLTLVALWRRFLWGIPLAALLALVAFVTLWHELPAYAGCGS